MRNHFGSFERTRKSTGLSPAQDKSAQCRQTGAAPILILIAIIGLVVFLALAYSAPFKGNFFSLIYPKQESQAAGSFLETFDTLQPVNGVWPSHTPQAFKLLNWDVQIHSRQEDEWYSMHPMDAEHGTDCSGPPNLHRLNGNYEDYVFTCRNHLMTGVVSTEVGYALAYITPPAMVDFSQGEASIKFDLSSFRASARDWMDMWVTPFDENLAMPLEPHLPDLQGGPRRSVHMKFECDGFSCGTGSKFFGAVYRNFNPTGVGGGNAGAFENVTPTHAARRDTYELKISRTSLKMCLISINYSASTPGPQGQTTPQPVNNYCWVNTNIADLGWDKGVVQFGHHSYTPEKDCQLARYGGCPGTWHWDNISINPAIPFTIIRADKRQVSASSTDNSVNFPAPAPTNAFLRYSGTGINGTLKVSFDNGQTWVNGQYQPQNFIHDDGYFRSYMQPIPQGTTKVMFQGQSVNSKSPWMFRDITIFSTTYDGTPLPSVTPTPQASIQPSTTPSQTPSSTPIPDTLTVTFDDKSGQDAALTSQYPTSVIDWGNTGDWWHSSPWELLTTKSLTFNGAGVNSASFLLLVPKVLTKLDTYNGGASDSTVTLVCPGNANKIVTISSKQLLNVMTNWTQNCSAVTISSTNGWETNFDNLVFSPVSTPASASPTPQPSVKPGDIDGNNKVDIFDFNTLLTNFGQTGVNNPADLDKNGKVDIFDFNILLTNFGK